MHGANATGRPFTGDYAGILLYATLFKFGFATRPDARGVDDGLRLIDARITNAVKCVPPENKPLPAEIRECNAYLAAELARSGDYSTILALGRIAHDGSIDQRVGRDVAGFGSTPGKIFQNGFYAILERVGAVRKDFCLVFEGRS